MSPIFQVTIIPTLSIFKCERESESEPISTFDSIIFSMQPGLSYLPHADYWAFFDRPSPKSLSPSPRFLSILWHNPLSLIQDRNRAGHTVVVCMCDAWFCLETMLKYSLFHSNLHVCDAVDSWSKKNLSNQMISYHNKSKGYE